MESMKKREISSNQLSAAREIYIRHENERKRAKIFVSSIQKRMLMWKATWAGVAINKFGVAPVNKMNFLVMLSIDSCAQAVTWDPGWEDTVLWEQMDLKS